MNIIEAEIIEYLIINDYELVYDDFGIFVGIKGGNGALLNTETMQEIKHISKSTWNAISTI
jgi:hypothetical protein